MKCSLNIPNFLKRSLVFPILLLSSLSLHWSLRKAFLSLLAILWNSAFKWEYLSFYPLLFASLLSTANGNLLQKVPCRRWCTQCPQPCGRPLLTHTSARLLDTHKQVWVCLLWGHWPFLLTPSTSQLWLTWTEHHSIKLRSSWSKVKP